MNDVAKTPAQPPKPSLTYLITAAVIVLALFSLAPYMPVSTIMTDLPSHFVLQYFIGSFILGVIVLVDKYPKYLFGLVVFSCVLNLLQLWPQTSFGTPPVFAGTPLKILQSNVLFLNGDTDSLKALVTIEKPDLIVAEEVTPVFETMFGTLKTDYPYQTIWAEANDGRGLAVLSKVPLDRSERQDFGTKVIPTMVFAIKHDDQEVTFVSVHPPTPNVSLRARDQVLGGIADMFKDLKAPLVVLGDFNATPYSPALKHLTAALQLTNARRGRGINGTWPAGLNYGFLQIPIDNALISETIGVTDYRLGPDISSDHLPSIITLAFREKKKDTP
ncbi:MAG: endonuclease/exonuclease/phosphatase family protein [Micavibrio sp.]|nr:endonuclease/exonuclease/phosphatase family protein [Micavibrio sp.]